MKILTTTDVAERLGVSVRAVQRAAKKHGVGTLAGKVLIFSATEADSLRSRIPGKVGNPNFNTGNELWKTRKNSGRKSKKED